MTEYDTIESDMTIAVYRADEEVLMDRVIRAGLLATSL
jgi:hypothetical protein